MKTNTRKYLTILLTLLGLTLLTMGVVHASPAASIGDNTTTPQKLLYSYYNDINLQDYRSAYNLWINPRQTYDQFAAGFATTARVEPYFGAIQPVNATQTGQIPAVLVGYHTDGTILSYYGCFSVQNSTTTGWKITAAKIYTLSSTAAPDSVTTTTYLSIDCSKIISGGNKADTFKTLSSMATVLETYYDAINGQDYQTAYSMWLQPIPGPKPNGQPAQDYRPTYDAFTKGYSDTFYVDLYTGVYNEMGASAGHGYLNGMMPVVLIGQHTDGTFIAYSGCYVMGFKLDGTAGIVSGKLTKLVDGIPSGTDILTALNIDCTALGLSY